MKNKVAFFLITVSFCFLLALAGCHRRSVPVQVIQQHTTDTITINRVQVKLDTVVRTEADTLVIIDTINCDNAKVEVNGKDGKVEATVKNGVLKIKTIRASKIIPIRVTKEVPVTNRVRTEIREVAVEVIKKKWYIPWWCWALLLWNAAAIAWRFRSPISAFFNGFKS
jgi:hypothetical protein